ncbi:MAG: winged helix-turn-helix transcriptional regulator [Nitrospiraceae bacterium]|nr:winged helix-turn-helix transcriptional regulator [Nitrospiraceae bacterium]
MMRAIHERLNTYEILTSEQITHEKLAERIGVSAPTINWHIRHLKEQGIVGAVMDGRYTAYSIDRGYYELLRDHTDV